MSKSEVELVSELSPMQQAMLFACLYAPGSGVYVIQLSLRLSGRLDIEAFEESWRRVVERHDVLRTGFHWEDLEKPMQVAFREVDLEIRRESWRGLDRDAQEERLQEFLDADRESGFELTEPPLMRLALFELDANVWHLVWTIHHLVVDGWSVGLLLKELFTGYAAFAAGREPMLPWARSYGDFIAWLQRQDAAAAEAFWRESLAGLAAPTLMAGGDGRGAGGFRQTGRRGVRLGPDESAALRELAREGRLTLNTLVQGAWALLLAQATGSDDVVFGGTVAGRPGDLPGADSMIGLFINTLPVRVEVDPERCLLPWLEDLQERQVEARGFDHAPLHEIQTWSELPAGTALFDNILVFESYPLESSLVELLPELSLSRLAVNEITNYPLNLVVYPGAELSLELVYDAGRFDPAAVLRLLERLRGALRAFPDAADRPLATLADIPLLLAGERQQVLVEWNDTAGVYPREACLPDLFAAVVREAPDAPALIAVEGEVWSYRRLEQAANGLARHLRSRGVGPETRVALCMERSPELIVSVLAVLKAGGAYAPLDAGYPDERLAFMLADTSAPFVLVDARTKPRLEGMAPLIPVDETAWEQEGAEPVDVPVPAESLALVIYTSGSTGRPKGVALTHRGVVRMVRETDYARWGRRDCVAHLSNISFDAATMEIWAALLNGAALAIIPRDEALSPAWLGDRIRRDGVTWMVLTTALFNQVAREQPEALEPLSAVMFAGEAADPSAVARMLGHGPQLLNGYGPAEGTTISTWHRVRELAPDAVTVPIGLPVANTSVVVLDHRQDLVPPGVVGELFIGGDGLARGYLNRPDLTAERFVPHPLGSGERLYRTGDLVRQRTDGVLEFVGRRDDQVKIRGFRIEPGEIEAVLAAHPDVAACAVVVRREAPGAAKLVGYVVLHRSDVTPTLTTWLRERLPSFMLPSAWVFLDALPLTPNGKVDRKALPAPEQAPEDESYAAPADPIEELLAGIWAEVLGRERVGVHHDFFELGGHSLLATQVASRIRGVLGVELPLRSVFEAPTVAGLARRVRAGLEGEEAPPLVRVSREADLPLSFAQQRLWFIDQLEPGNPGYNIPAAVRLIGDLSVPRLAGALAGVVGRHEVLRTTFDSRDGQAVQVVHPEVPAALPVVDLSDLPAGRREAMARRLAVEESLRPFDLEAGPLLRITLLRLDGRKHLLLLTLHHIVSDGWSMNVLVREVQALYRGAVLPDLPIQYADFAAWQRQWLAGEVLERQLAWWREHLEGTSGVLELPTDHPRPATLSLRGAEHRFAVDPELSRRLVEIGRREGATPFMILAAGLFALLSRLSGQRDLNLGSPIANRNRIETEGLIGFFVNTLVLRAQVGREASFLDLLLQVREASLGAYAHQDLPFEKLVDEVQPERDLSRSPLVQVALAVNNAPISRVGLPGLELIPEAPPTEVAKFDLAFIFFETGEGLAGSLEYATDLYEAATAARLARQLVAFLSELTADPELPLSDLSPLTREERHQVLIEWNDTAAEVRQGVLLHQLFEERVDAQPEALAVVYEGEAWSYRELEARANRLACFLRDLVDRQAPVGVWMERSPHMLAAVLGILKAGGTYVPLDAAWPADRVETILANMGAPAIVADRRALRSVDEIRWRLPRLDDTIVLDVETPEPEPERVDAASIRSLFDLVAERASDRVTAGGFIHRDTGLPFSEAEVDEYRDRVLALAAPWLRPDARVLEVGSGSGLILWEMAKRVERCVGLDPSPLTQERNRELGLANVELPVGFAHEIADRFAPGSFDLVVFASTVQFFPGPRYLEKVMADALRLLAPGGAVLVADVIDPLGEELFHDLGAAEILHRTEGFANELGERYDVILRPGEPGRSKRTWTGWHVERAAATRPPAVGSPEDIAYVIHTSGSTGTPKGIAVQHAPAVQLVGWVNRSFGVGPEDRLLFVTSLCFDLSVYDIFGTLGAGGTVHVASEAALREPGELLRLLREEPITVWDSAPAALQQLAPLFPDGEERPLRLVMLSGDWIPVPLPDQVRSAFPGTRVISLGGATEATVWSNWYPVGAVDPGWPSIPYGRPIANARYHVLDETLLPCPIGIPGDLYIGGSCLCVGYAGQPELTAAAFLPDPFAEEPGARLYRTGDRSRFFRDGNLEFLGRVDQQVKVRGYRIELGEIEVALLRHPDVREAVAGVLEGRLVAWVVLDPTDSTDLTDLGAWLRDRLPQYMLPSAFVQLDAMPVTANGKLDRQALPAPERGGEDEGYEAPSDPAEETLAALWAELLGLERVGIHESFFTLGGHSLLATQLMSRLRGAFGVELQLRELFEAPTIAGLARTVRQARQEALRAPPVTPAPRDGDLPLSFAQQRLWLLDQLEPGSPAYNIPLAVRMSGELSVGLLRRIFAEIVRRHEALRTTFASRDGRPVQVIASELEVELPLVDLASLPDEEREARARRLVREEMLRPFSLQTGPLLRTTLVRMDGREHLLLLTLHHIVADGWSMGVLLREIAALHDAFAQGRPSPLPELPVQYADFAVWQRKWLQGDVLQEQLDVWKRRLAGTPRILELPTDRPRPSVPSYRGATRPLTLAPGPSMDLRALCGREGVTPFMALLAVWTSLLGRHAGQEDVLVGSPVANRGRREIEDLIGFFANTLVLRADLSGAPSFLGLLACVRTVALEAYGHQDLPFERLVEELVPERDLAVSPLVQVLFVLQNAAASALSVPGLILTPLGLESATSKFDLMLYLTDTGDGALAGGLEHSTDLFDADRIGRLLQHLGILLSGALAEPERPLAELPLLTPEERARVLDEWNDNAVDVRRVAVHVPVEEQAERTPEALAAVWSEDGTALTYGDLDRQANRLAGHLRALGVGPDDRVGICLERSLAPLVAVLGVLKAGGAYVPIDPDYPADRVAFLLADSRCRVLIDRAFLDSHGEAIAAHSTANPTRLTSPDHLAYVIYTSGSTGRPKGVAMPHGVLANMLAWQCRASAAGPGSRTLQFASLSFDVSFQEIFSTWWTGGTIVALPQETRRDAMALCQVLDEQRIERLFVPFVALQQIGEVIEHGAPVPAALTEIITAGEQLQVTRQIAAWLERSGASLDNHYGPSEGHVVTAHRLAGRPAEWPALPPIGRPISNVRVYLLDWNFEPVPQGVPGHLCFGGTPVVRGYLDRPELTAERFVPDPFGGEPGARLYATGDRAQALADGTFRYLGRIDQQVKIRGFRVEPGEVESALTRHPAVRAAAVVVQGDGADRRLVGYYVADVPLASGELRAVLARELPDYMVPALLVRLDALPLTPSGKLDRRALPDPQTAGAMEADEAVPSDPVEELLAGIWAEILRRGRVGIHDDFFALGGHSLLATQVISRVRTVLGLDLPLRQLFETPTVAGFAEAVRAVGRGGKPGAPPLVSLPGLDAPPLSFAQQRLWLLDQMEPGQPAYNIPLAVRLSGELSVEALERTFAEVVRRHAVLRTTFAVQNGQPVQVIAPPEAAPPGLEVLDLSEAPAEASEEWARELALEEARSPFDLTRGPLLRLGLLRLDDREHLLLVTFHHIVSDGWSLGVLLREVEALYPAFLHGEPSPLPELPLQYADFALWQRSWLQGEVLERQLDDWKDTLAGAPQVLELPVDRPRPAVPSHAGAAIGTALPGSVSDAVQDLCAREQVTPFMLLLTAWAVVLGRHTGQDDLLVGTPIAGRNRRETEDLIGFFVSTLVLRMELSGEPAFRGLLRRVRETALEAFAHQEIPFERLVEALVPTRDLAVAPLVQATFVLQNAPRPSIEVPGLVLTPIEVPTGLTKFDLSLGVKEGISGFSAGLEYSTELFDRSTAERLLARFAAFLESALAEPGRPVTDLPLLLPAERHQALVEWNDTAAPFPGAASLPELFEQVVQACPEAPAIVAPSGEVWSYRRLDEAADRLARRLRALGVAPEAAVGLSLERSPELIVGMLAILKAGGVYVPLEAGHPDERLAFVLEETGARVVLTDETARDRFAGFAQVAVVAAEDRTADDGGGSFERMRIPSARLAYVIYTSGSTGRPKGVAVSHRAVVRLVKQERPLGLRAGDRLAFNANPAFDAATYEIWGTLLAGATLVVIPQSILLSPADLAACLERERVTVLHLTAALFALVTREAPAALALPHCVLFGGEATAPAVVARALEEGRPQRLLHLYGPTESTAFATFQTVAELAADAAVVPAGRPLANTVFFVLDRWQQPVPPGVVGELLLGGDGLARGYLRRPDLTAERFIPDPWGSGERLYRTGDLVRQRPDGSIEILGRIDTQVKIRGFRVEPGEIEAILAAHPDVRECAVVARRDGGEIRLVAYVVPDRTDPADLTSVLREKLPDFMVPAAVVILKALPLTANGKVDRRALPAPDAVSGREYVAPSSPIEKTLARIWAAVLRLDRVGVQDNFFTLGGHSLLAVQLVSRMREVLHVEVPLRSVFAAPTIAELARAVSAMEAAPAPPPLRAGDRAHDPETAPPLSFAQQRLWFMDQLEPGHPAYNIPLTVRLTGELSVEALESTFAEVVRRHAVLRTTFAVRGGQPVQVVAPPDAARPGLRVLDLSGAPEEAREEWARELVLEEARSPFDLARGPLLRLGLLRLDEREHLLLVTFHHIVSDGWSVGVLLREIGSLYPAFLRGEPSPLPELPLQYADFSVWQRSWLQGEVLERQLAYWRGRLAGAPQVLDLPEDRPRPAVPTHGGASLARTLPAPLTEAVQELCAREQVTPFMLMLAVWAVVLGRHAAQDDVLVGTPIAGRNRRETEALIGFFVNTLVLRIELSGDPGFGELLRHVREAALDAFAHQDLPFELLVDELVVERSLAHTPLIQVMLNLQNAPAEELRLPGLTLASLHLPSTTAKLDLALALGETADGFVTSLEYATDLFDRTTAERLVRHFANLLTSATADPGRPLSDLRLMDAAEEQMLLQIGLGRAKHAWAASCAVHDLLTRQARRIPDKIAAIGPQGALTYRELNERSSALASLLRSALPGPRLDRRIGLLADADPQVLIGMIGILKSGGGFVPIDPRHPDERAAWILNDAACEALVTDRHHLERAVELAGGCHVFCLDEASDAGAADAGEVRDPRELQSLAYVVYTSGSTGRPKGVQVSHESLVPILLWGCDQLGLGETTRVLQSLSFCFDFGIFEHLTTVLAGGTLVFPGEAAGDPAALVREIVRHEIDTLHMTPAFVRELAAIRENLVGLEVIHLGGEALPWDTVERLQVAAPRAAIYNGYGPTEATINSSIFRVEGRVEGRVDGRTEGIVPIGRRSADNALHVLDRAGRLAPFGAWGELHVGGIGVARGYLGRSDLTAERFMPDPFGETPGGRLYRTGDVVRSLPGGDLEFLGRIDDQVKLHGFRIELGEIEAVLRSHAALSDCVVVVRRDTGDARLVAYVVLDQTDQTDRTDDLTDPSHPSDRSAASSLAAWLRGKLPEHMVPSFFVFLEALPLTPTGKVDRKALPTPEPRADASRYVAPEGPVEERLAEVWQEILRLDRVGVQDNFFAVGGNSLLATQLTTRLREALGVELPVRRVFEAPTIRQLSRILRDTRGFNPLEDGW